MNKPKLIVADIDGTLRGKGALQLGSLTKQAFEDLHNDGVLLGIASGRPLWQQVQDHYKDWGLSFQFDLLIGMNGSEIFDSKTNIKTESNLLSKDSLKEIVTKMHSLNLNPFVYRDGYELSLRMDDFIMESAKRHFCRIELCKDESDLWSEDTAKILYRADTPEQGENVEEYAKKICNDNFTCFRTGPELVEFQDPNINKGVAVKKYCDSYGIDMNDVIAFGDAENDIQMLQMSGHSVCLLNGLDNVKMICDDITTYDSDHDGVGHYLYENIMNK